MSCGLVLFVTWTRLVTLGKTFILAGLLLYHL